MTFKGLARLVLAFLGAALLLAGLFFDFGIVASRQQMTPTPTRDRLAQPTLPLSPSQADHGAQVYWLSCLPCHGDLGQGLTDEFRQAYPPEDRNCWESGCHGERPYDNGFRLPKAIPAVIGREALKKYSNAAVLQAYIKATMPYWKPGSLTDEDAWAVTAFLLRESEVRDEQVELNASNASQVRIHTDEATSTPVSPVTEASDSSRLVGTLIIAGFALVFILIWWLRRTPGSHG